MAAGTDISPEVEEEDTAEVSLFMVMFSVFAVMMFMMWLMLRRCQNPDVDEEEETKRKRGSYVPTRI